MDTHEIFKAAGDLLSARRPFVLATVVRTQGSTPRDPGARMIWTPGEGFVGTVGGGQFEHLVKDAAELCFQQRSSSTERFTLGSDADQCCGGTMDVFFEFLGPHQRIVLFGAGHVARALAGLLTPGGFEITIVDDRADWNSPERFCHCTRITDFAQGLGLCAQTPQATLACVMTCSHDRDFDLICALLRSPPAYIGLIGSKSKRACFLSRLSGAGVTSEQIERLRCPMGVGDTGKEPRLVAISIAAELLMRARDCASL